MAGASDTGNAIGDYVEIIPDSEWVNNLISGVLAQHNQDGTHGNITATGLTVNGAFAVNGTWDGWVGVSDSWSYGSASSPEFTITVPAGATSLYQAGDRIKLTQTTVKYFIITKVASTTLTVYGGTDYTLANAAISSIYVSRSKSPFGFPLDPDKWTVENVVTTDTSQSSPVIGTWYNLCGSVSIPIGVWAIYYSGAVVHTATSAAFIQFAAGLGTTNSSIIANTEQRGVMISSSAGELDSSFAGTIFQNVSSTTTYYLNLKRISGASGLIRGVGTSQPLIIRAVCAYL